MSSADKAVRKYLAAWAEPEIAVADAVPRSYDQVLVVPACDENATFVRDLEAVPGLFDRPALVIVVINGSAVHPERVHHANAALWDELSAGGSALSPDSSAVWNERRGFDLLCVDRASEARRFPAKRGVGLARKVGCDLALALVANGRVDSPWIHTSDADARQPTERFRVAAHEGDRSVAALTFPYAHEPSGGSGDAEAIRLYELSLRYWVLALAWAGSPYAFSSIGSTFAIRASAYACVRGFPRREAGEDFHLLDKVAKLGIVRTPKCAPVVLSGRASDRVPFGTGRAVRRMRDELRDHPESFGLYVPRAFELLRTWLRTMQAWAGGSDMDVSALPGVARDILDELGVVKTLSALKARTPDGEMGRAFHAWFDALKTLRFLHGARDRGMPNRPFRRALRDAPFAAVSWSAPVPDLLQSLASRPVADAGVPALLTSVNRSRPRSGAS